MRTGNVIQLPFGVAQLFKVGDSTTIKSSDKISHRPDKVLEAFGLASYKDEMANNRISNVSPISLKAGTLYTMLDSLFLSYFRSN